MAKLFLGLDSSTQSLSAIVIDYDAREVIYETSLNFDKALPAYGTQNGVLPNTDPLIKHSPPLMWVEALDQLFATMKRDSVPLGDIRAISGSGQQHGSVYLNERAAARLGQLDPTRTLVENLGDIFSRPTSPIWMDASTSSECAEIRDALGGVQATAAATGSDAFERFTGPQIRKFSKTQPALYSQTATIGLVSSLMASLMAGRIAPIDHGDGAGMNLMDITRRQWHPRAIDATAPRLGEKLPPLAEPWQTIGPINPYFVTKYGFRADAQALVWSGDNPCSVVGLGLLEEGMIAVSLGTSYTYFGRMHQCRTDARGEGHVFGSPTGDYMTLICFANGSLAREKIRDQFNLDWEQMNQLTDRTPPGNLGGLMLPWFEPEIVPRVTQPGIARRNLNPAAAAANCRGLIEAQMLSMRLHSRWMQVKRKQIFATGGGSVNRPLLQIMADVMNCPVARIEVSKSAALGAALRAVHGYLQHSGEAVTWKQVCAGFTDPVPHSEILPNPAAVKVYDEMIERYAAFERATLQARGIEAPPE